MRLIPLRQAAIELYGPSKTIQEENDKYIRLLCLADKGLKIHRVMEQTHDGKQVRKVKVNGEDLALFKEAQ